MTNPFAFKSKEQVLETWQAKALRAAKGKLGRVLLQSMRKEYIGVTDTSWATLLRWIYKVDGYLLGLNDLIKFPRLQGYGRVELSGRVTCVIQYEDMHFERIALYRSKDEFVGEARLLADALQLADFERVEMFALLGKWIPEDHTIGLHGEKVA